MVAAGWYVGAGLSLLALGLPPRVFDNAILRGTLIVVGALCLAGAAYEWWLRKPAEAPVGLFFDIAESTLPARTAGVAAVFELMPGSPSGIGSMGAIYNSDHERELEWPTDEGQPLRALKCQLTNYSTAVIANVSLRFPVTIRRCVRRANLEVVGGNQYLAGDVLVSDDFTVSFKKLEPGSEHTIVFYLLNARQQWIEVTVPVIATFELLHDRMLRTADLPPIFPKQRVLFPTRTSVGV